MTLDKSKSCIILSGRSGSPTSTANHNTLHRVVRKVGEQTADKAKE
jgi:hypothetical protein